MASDRVPVVVLGAGPAGLGAAYCLAGRGCFDVTVVERSGAAGGNAGSFEIDGLRVDYGSHRLHPSCKPEILADIRAMIGPDLLERPRHGRIRLQGRWVHFPLKPADLALHLPPSFVLGVARDAVTRPFRGSANETFAAVLERGLGPTISREFYFPYAEKIWGLPPGELDAEQARRRISASSLAKMARKALSSVPGFRREGFGRFFYPKRGYGQISEAYLEAARQHGAAIRFRTAVTGVEVREGSAIACLVRSEAGEERLPSRMVLSTIPLTYLARLVVPTAPANVLQPAAALQYRAMILVYLVLDADRFSEYDAHYLPGPETPVTRVSEPKNYGLAESPGTTVLCAELPCSPGDPVWRAADEELGTVALEGLAACGAPVRARVRKVITRRLEQAYPIYTRAYREHFDCLEAWIDGIDGLMTFGRQGLFAHDNTHHALAMAYAASDSIDDRGVLDRARWDAHRRSFQEHVVED